MSPVADSDKALLDEAEATAAKAVATLVQDGIEKGMGLYNGMDLRESVGEPAGPQENSSSSRSVGPTLKKEQREDG